MLKLALCNLFVQFLLALPSTCVCVVVCSDTAAFNWRLLRLLHVFSKECEELRMNSGK